MISSQNEDLVAINARVSREIYENMQEVAKSLDMSLSALIASAVTEYLHQVTSNQGAQTVDLEIARFAYAKKKNAQK